MSRILIASASLILFAAIQCKYDEDLTRPEVFHYLRIVHLAQGIETLDMLTPEADTRPIRGISYLDTSTSDHTILPETMLAHCATQASYTDEELDNYQSITPLPAYCYNLVTQVFDHPRLVDGSGPEDLENQGTTIVDLSRVSGQDGVIDLVDQLPDSTCSEEPTGSRYFTIVVYRNPPHTVAPESPNTVQAQFFEDCPKPAMSAGQYGLRVLNRAAFLTGDRMLSLSIYDSAISGNVGTSNIVRASIFGNPANIGVEGRCKTQYPEVSGAEAYCSVPSTTQLGAARQYACPIWATPTDANATEDWWSVIVDGRWDPNRIPMDCSAATTVDEGVGSSNSLVSASPYLTNTALTGGAYYTLFVGGGHDQSGSSADAFEASRITTALLPDVRD